MNTNIDHDVFAKKLQSIELANQVEEFLKSQNLEEPVQIPFGYSADANRFKNGEKYNAQETMRQIMFSSVSAARKKKSGFISKSHPAVISEHTRLDHNRNERNKAFKANFSRFTGICKKHGKTEFAVYSDGSDHKCLICKREIAHKFQKKEGAA
ncbi:hypothetical protein [Acinetobacter bereziniae]|uniref:hypothetical protein n=1 Tax=Acinetobacter bereziniae TaxID=106648 RepID=UPI000C2C48C4|nr:hypothetical protein [Acinetobacter bereziniae]ATZ64270.1 hypothetical protein BSR55_13280 [Acinetobacter bereziniae]